MKTIFVIFSFFFAQIVIAQDTLKNTMITIVLSDSSYTTSEQQMNYIVYIPQNLSVKDSVNLKKKQENILFLKKVSPIYDKFAASTTADRLRILNSKEGTSLKTFFKNHTENKYDRELILVYILHLSSSLLELINSNKVSAKYRVYPEVPCYYSKDHVPQFGPLPLSTHYGQSHN